MHVKTTIEAVSAIRAVIQEYVPSSEQGIGLGTNEADIYMFKDRDTPVLIYRDAVFAGLINAFNYLVYGHEVVVKKETPNADK